MFIKNSFIRAPKILAAISLMVITLLSMPSIAATYYVSPAGTAAWAECINESTSCAAQTAMSNAMAGDIVYFRGGTYEVVGPHMSYHGVLEPANSGTSNANTITFASYPNELPIINCTIGVTDDVCFAIGTGGQDYITWDGFMITSNNGVKMGGMMVGQSDEPRSIGNTIENCIIDGGSTVITSTDNRESIRMEKTTGTTIRGCTLYNMKQVDDWDNTAAIKMYFNDNVMIENNEIYNCTAGIYLKADIDNSIVRNNFIHDCARGIPAQVYLTRNSDNVKVYNNVIVNNSFSGIAVAQNEEATADNWEIYNNTIVNSVRGIVGAKGNWSIWNNLIVNNSYDITTSQGNILSEADHNSFGSDAFKVVLRLYGADSYTATSLSTWQVSGQLSGGGNAGVGSITGDPQFVNVSSTLSDLYDFVIAPGSPAIGAGRGGEDMGANIDAVGTGKKRPAAAINLAVNE